MKYTLLCVIFVLAAASASGSQTTCPTGSYSLYLGAGFTCQTDGTTFSGFGGSVGPGGIPISAITVAPIAGPGFAGFQFNGAFTANPGQTITYMMSYFADPPPIIHGEQIDLDPFGNVSLQTDLCISMALCQANNFSTGINATTNSPMASIQFANTNVIGVRNTLTLTGGNTGANSQGFDNQTMVLPEPSTILLAASGLLGLLACRRRAKLRKIRF